MKYYIYYQIKKIILFLFVFGTSTAVFGQKMNGKLLVADNAYYFVPTENSSILLQLTEGSTERIIELIKGAELLTLEIQGKQINTKAIPCNLEISKLPEINISNDNIVMLIQADGVASERYLVKYSSPIQISENNSVVTIKSVTNIDNISNHESEHSHGLRSTLENIDKHEMQMHEAKPKK